MFGRTRKPQGVYLQGFLQALPKNSFMTDTTKNNILPTISIEKSPYL
jgi:hypothetical protein